MEWNFGDILLTMFALFFWATFVWMFIGVFADIFRRSDLSGIAKAGWVALIVLLPFLGVLLYLVGRPATADRDLPALPQGNQPEHRTPAYSAADEIAKASRLQQEGVITTDEFAALKERALASQSTA